METVVRHFVPFLAGYFAGLAADADTGIGEEADFDAIVDKRVASLICALDAFANHSLSIFRAGPDPQVLSWKIFTAAVVPDANWMGRPQGHIV